MDYPTIFKRTAFWIGIAFIALPLVAGVYLTVSVQSGVGFVRSLVDLGKFSAFLIIVAFQSIPKAPGIAGMAVFWYALYLIALAYCAQTEFEKRLFRYAVPMSFVAIFICCIGVFGAVFSGLASQGAGQ